MDAPEREGKDDLKGLYDLAIPLGMPVSVIRELVENFELDVVRRKVRMDMTGEVMDREVVALRGDLETVLAAKKYMFEALDRKIESWDRDERGQRYRKVYEEMLKDREQEEQEKESGAKPDEPEQSS
jgi:hypothetical protein